MAEFALQLLAIANKFRLIPMDNQDRTLFQLVTDMAIQCMAIEGFADSDELASLLI